MEANFTFPNVKAYNVEKADVLLGETFRVELVGALPYALQWYSNNDSVLKVVVEQGSESAIIQATEVGDSELRLFDGDILAKRLNISVFSVEAASLNPKAGKIELKK